MNAKRILSAILICVMLLALFTACAKESTGDNGEKTSDSGGVASSPSVGTVEDSEPTEISFWVCDMGTAGSGSKWDIVKEAIDELTISEINVKVNFNWVSFGDLSTQFTLAMANKESVDLIVTTPVPAGSFTTYYTSGMAMDISELLEEHGQDIMELMSAQSLLNPFTMADGGIYGLPTYRILTSDMYVAYRVDALEAVGALELLQNASSWSDFEEVLAAFNDSGMYGITGGQKSFSAAGFIYGSDSWNDAYAYDSLGDTTNCLYTDQNGNVSLIFENEDYINQLKMHTDWYQKGYLNPDSAYTEESGDMLISRNVAAGQLSQTEFGSNANAAANMGGETISIQVTQGMLSTASCTKFAMIVPTTSSEPAAAVKFLNLLYTSTELMNLLCWGVEGETYVVTEGEAHFPEGLDASTSGYKSGDYVMGNQFKATPWIGNGANFREEALANFLASPTSAYMGLAVDTSDYGTLLAALASVRDEYRSQLVCGMYSDSLCNEFIQKLNASGMDEYISIYQSTVDNFMS